MAQFVNDGSFMAQMMAQMANPQGEQGASAGAPPPPPPPPVSTAAPLPPGPPPAAAASAPPPAAVLSVAERIAAKIAAKAATEGSSAGGGDAASSISISSSFGGSGAGSSSSAADGGRKRKFTEGEARERPSARCAVDRSEDSEVHAVALREARDDLQAPVEQPRVIQRIGNMLPEEELAKYTTLLPGNDKKRKEEEEDKGETIVIDSANVGHKLLSKMGWKAGKGLGAKESGKIEPVGAAKKASEKSGIMAGDMHGVGAAHTWDLDGSEDMYEQYRKRNMLGYRHRPNPFNNPRQLYY